MSGSRVSAIRIRVSQRIQKVLRPPHRLHGYAKFVMARIRQLSGRATEDGLPSDFYGKDFTNNIRAIQLEPCSMLRDRINALFRKIDTRLDINIPPPRPPPHPQRPDRRRIRAVIGAVRSTFGPTTETIRSKTRYRRQNPKAGTYAPLRLPVGSGTGAAPHMPSQDAPRRFRHHRRFPDCEPASLQTCG